MMLPLSQCSRAAAAAAAAAAVPHTISGCRRGMAAAAPAAAVAAARQPWGPGPAASAAAAGPWRRPPAASASTSSRRARRSEMIRIRTIVHTVTCASGSALGVVSTWCPIIYFQQCCCHTVKAVIWLHAGVSLAMLPHVPQGVSGAVAAAAGPVLDVPNLQDARL